MCEDAWTIRQSSVAHDFRQDWHDDDPIDYRVTPNAAASGGGFGGGFSSSAFGASGDDVDEDTAGNEGEDEDGDIVDEEDEEGGDGMYQSDNIVKCKMFLWIML